MSSVCENKRFVERLAVHTTYTHRYSGHEERDGRDKDSFRIPTPTVTR